MGRQYGERLSYEKAARLADGNDQDRAFGTKLLLPKLDVNPHDAQALFILGYTFMKSGNYGLAYQLNRRAAELAPHMQVVWHNLGKCAYECQKYEEAEDYWRKAVKLKPDYPLPIDGLGLINLNRGDYDLAIEYTTRSLKHDPDSVDSLVNRGMAYLAKGMWKEGWIGYNANLGVHKDRKERIAGNEVRWDGTKGQKVFCYGEQGIGDEISFASCLPDLIRDSSKVVIECDRRLEGLFKRSFPQCPVYGTRYDSEPHRDIPSNFDARVSVGQLPQFYRNSDSEFPGAPYLVASPEMRVAWKGLLDSLGPEPKIGIAWSGGRRHTGQSRRSVTLETLLPILKYPAHWISLQYQTENWEKNYQLSSMETPPEIAEFEEKHGIKIHHWPWGTQSYDYDQTAALVAELDLVITVTTTVVHLAGALGVDCWTLVPDKVMWRYLAGRGGEVFPWAKSVTLFRQKKDWPTHLIYGKLKDKFGSHTDERNKERSAA